MRCLASYLILAGLLSGCQTPERAAIQPLPPDAPALPYADVVSRTQDQIEAAQKFFYRDDWESLAQASEAIKQSAERLGKIKTDEIPEPVREQRDAHVKALADSAVALGEAAKTKSVNDSADAMQTLHKTLRLMKPRD